MRVGKLGLLKFASLAQTSYAIPISYINASISSVQCIPKIEVVTTSIPTQMSTPPSPSDRATLPSKPHLPYRLLRAPSELRQAIFRYIFKPTGAAALTFTVTATETETPSLSTHNGPTISALTCTSKHMHEGLSDYLFNRATFRLHDTQRPCKSLVDAFVARIGTRNCARITRVAVPFLTIRGLFNTSHWPPPFHLPRPFTGDEWKMTTLTPFKPYVRDIAGREHSACDISALYKIRAKLQAETERALYKLVYSLPALKNLELGIDVLELLVAEQGALDLDMTCFMARENSRGNYFLGLIGQVRAARRFGGLGCEGEVQGVFGEGVSCGGEWVGWVWGREEGDEGSVFWEDQGVVGGWWEEGRGVSAVVD